MDFSAIFQIRTKRYWWVDVIFYFAISLLIAALLIYVIFLFKNGMIKKDIELKNADLLKIGTGENKRQEAEVVQYRAKINDFSDLIENHEFASNVFVFVKTQTMPNIWFKQFSLDSKKNTVQLFGESDDMDAFSRQVDAFEKNKYVKSIGTLNSALGGSARIDFNINLLLDPSIFNYRLSSIASETSQTQQ